MNAKFKMPPKPSTGNVIPEVKDASDDGLLSLYRPPILSPQKPTMGESADRLSEPQGGAQSESSMDSLENLGHRYLVADSRRKPDEAKVTVQYHLRLTPPQGDAVEKAFLKSGYRFKSEWLRAVFFRGLELEERLKK